MVSIEMSKEDFKVKLIYVLNSLKNGSTTTNVQADVESLKAMKISPSEKTKIMQNVKRNGNYIQQIPRLAPLMQRLFGGRRKHTHRKRKTLRKRKTRTLRSRK